MHDGFIKLFAKIHAYSGKGSFNGWMRRVFVTTVLESLRRKDALRHSVDVESIDVQDEEIDISVFDHLSSDDLFACIARLPDKYRTVFNMHAIEEYTFVEIAGILGINENTARTQYAKARQLLQKMVLEVGAHLYGRPVQG
jgi:RNA polymerase sigma-70 factor (ECF subfamily)